MRNYTKSMNWAVVCFIDRKTQDDRKSKLQVEALFSSLVQAKDNYIIRNEEIKRYILHVDNLERFEEFYNRLQDLKAQYGEAAIYHLQDNNNFTVDEQNRFRELLHAWVNFNEIV